LRSSCLDCSRKHIGEAEVLLREARMGYPLHAWYAVAHLSQAEAELLNDYPEMAHKVRTERINLIDNLEYSIDEEELVLIINYKIDTLCLIEELTILQIAENPTII